MKKYVFIIFTSVLLMTPFLSPFLSHAEVIEAVSLKPITVILKPGRTTQIIFPMPLDTVEKKESSGLSIKAAPKLKDMLMIDANYLGSPQDVYVTDIHGTRFHFIFDTDKDSTQDSTIIIKNKSSNAARSIEQVKNTPLVTLLAAMAADRRLAGYSVEKMGKPKRIYYRDGVAVYIHRTYKSAIWTGYVATVENTNEYPVTWNVKEFSYDGLVAIGSENSLLSPKPRFATEYLAKKYRTRMEFVVDTTTDPDDLGTLD